MKRFQHVLLLLLIFFIKAPLAESSNKEGVLKQLTVGDHACYADFINGEGKPFSEMATFEICERHDLIGQKVNIEFKEGKVYAASCQGNMDCTDTETVMLVAQLVPVNDAISNTSRCFETAMDQSALTSCAVEEYENTEAELKQVYTAIMEKYRDDPRFLEKLEMSQQAWLGFRDAEVAAHYPHQDEPGYYGSVLPMCINGLLTELTRTRILQLRQWLQDPVEGNVCSY